MLSFRLSDTFVADYETRKPNWGFNAGAGNSLGEITYLTKYSRRKEDNSRERWHETCRRVIEGYYSILKDHCKQNRTPWNEFKAQKAAEDAFDRLFSFKWTPPGRGLWMMGTPMVNEQHNSAALQNCAFISTEKLSSHSAAEATLPFVRLMEMSMLGVGVGFDTKGAGNLTIHAPRPDNVFTIEVDDTREGWYESVGTLLESYFFKNRPWIEFDYSKIRPAGSPIKTFGGVAAGPGPLEALHKQIRYLFLGRAGETITSSDIVDIMNMIGKCVVSGNVRRSAEIAIGSASDEEFLNLKDWNVNPERMGEDGWGHTSNNSVFLDVGDDVSHLVNRIAMNGEPGMLYLDLCRAYGRLIDPPNFRDERVSGTNPCGEQSLESYECCVTGDTRIQTNRGPLRIGSLVGERVDVWNGDEWSEVVPFPTGRLPVYRVTLSDGSYLDATPGHEWLARRKTERTFKELTTSELEVGMYLPEFELPRGLGGKIVSNSYEWGWFAGDGYLDNGRPMALVQAGEYDVLEGMSVCSRYAEQRHASGQPFRRVSMAGIVPPDVASSLRDHYAGLPNEVMEMDSSSILEFVAGWIDTDGSVIRQPSTDHYVLYASEEKLRDLQILLRRAGINHAHISEFAASGSSTNLGTRNYPLWRLLIPSYECFDIPTRVKVATRFGSRFGINNAHPTSQIDRARKQKIVSIEKLSEGEETFCFNEPISHRGVFGNVLTKQCTLVETFPTNHDSLADYQKTLKHAYLYAKAVTLLPTHWPETNEIMQRNRRIGCSMSGAAQFVEANGWTELRNWMTSGYETVRFRDRQYSEWLGVRESIKMTSIKPSGTVSLLAGVTPGVHWPTDTIYIRRLRLAVSDPLVSVLTDAGYKVEADVKEPLTTVVVEIPVTGPQVRTEKQVSMWEKADLAVVAQRYWADNQVSVTVTFKDSERDHIGALLQAKEGQLKSLSMLPIVEGGAYKQMPYESISIHKYNELVKQVKPMDMDSLYDGESLDATGEKFCTNDRCEIV